MLSVFVLAIIFGYGFVLSKWGTTDANLNIQTISQISTNQLNTIADNTPPTNNTTLQWGAYTGGTASSLINFESLVGKKVDLFAVFVGWDSPFPSNLTSVIGGQGKTLVIFWEPSFGYDGIIDKSKDTYIKQFALDAKAYGFPIILSPFDEMNLNEEIWGYGVNNNTADKFKTSWIYIHDIFSSSGTTK